MSLGCGHWELEVVSKQRLHNIACQLHIRALYLHIAGPFTQVVLKVNHEVRLLSEVYSLDLELTVALFIKITWVVHV